MLWSFALKLNESKRTQLQKNSSTDFDRLFSSIKSILTVCLRKLCAFFFRLEHFSLVGSRSQKRRKSSNLTTTSEVLQTLHTKAPRRSKVLALSTNNRLLSMWDALGLPFFKFSSSYRLISMLFIEKSRLKIKIWIDRAWENFEQNFSKSRLNGETERSANQERVRFAARPIRIE